MKNTQRMILATLTLSLTLALPLVASARPLSKTKVAVQAIKTQVETCTSTAQSNMDLKICVGDGYEKVDQLLNTVYRNIMNELNKPSADSQTQINNTETKQRLIQAQRAWVTFKVANSDLAGVGSLGGTMESLERLDSLYTMTNLRVLELDQIFSYLDI
jgi:uncharacterized protein YecT (DUF1311 family)